MWVCHIMWSACCNSAWIDICVACPQCTGWTVACREAVVSVCKVWAMHMAALCLGGQSTLWVSLLGVFNRFLHPRMGGVLLSPSSLCPSLITSLPHSHLKRSRCMSQRKTLTSLYVAGLNSAHLTSLWTLQEPPGSMSTAWYSWRWEMLPSLSTATVKPFEIENGLTPCTYTLITLTLLSVEWEWD